jgi:hypothetical protein
MTLKIHLLVHSGQPCGEKRGGKNEDKCHDVVENKCRKNARFMASHDVVENKLVIIRLPLC